MGLSSRGLLLLGGVALLLATGCSEFHVLQGMYGCEVGPDGQFIGGHMQDAYDGEDFLALDLKTVTWTARVPQALETKRRWENEVHNAPIYKSFLEEECVAWLRRYLGYGNETLLRTEAPMTRVARKKGYDGRETLSCQLYGFYPKDIEVTWMKDGEVWHQDTSTGGVVPNSDGTYHTWLSIDVDPKEKDRYRCRVGHDSLLEPLNLAWEEPASSSGLIVGVLVGVLAAILQGGVGVAFYIRKRSQPVGGYKATAVEPSAFTMERLLPKPPDRCQSSEDHAHRQGTMRSGEGPERHLQRPPVAQTDPGPQPSGG